MTLTERLKTWACDERSGGCELLREEAADRIKELEAALREVEQSGKSSGGHRPLEDYTDGEGHAKCIWIARRVLGTKEG